MRKLILALMALAWLPSVAEAQQQQKFTADQGAAGSAPWPVTWGAGLAVNADLRVGGAAVAASNPVPVNVGNFPSTQMVSNAGTFAVQNTASIPAGANAIGSVGVTSLPSLPAGANNIGTIGNAFALDATVIARLGTLGQKASSGSAPVVLASDQSAVPIQGGNATAVKTDGSATTQPVSAVSLPLPAGASTAANQTSEITALGAPADTAWTGSGNSSIVAALKALYPRSLPFYETVSYGVASGTSYTGATRDGGAVNPWAKFNAVANATGAGTLIIQGSNDNFANTLAVTQVPVTAGSPSVVSVPVLFRYYRAVFSNTAGATNTLALNTSYTAN